MDRLQRLYSELSILPRRGLNQRLSFKGICSHAWGTLAKQKRSSLVKLLLLKACESVRAPTDETQPVSGLHVHIPKKQWTVQLIVLFTKKRSRGMTDEGNYPCAHRLFPLFTPFIDRNLWFARRCGWTQMNAVYTRIVCQMLLDHKDGKRVEASW